MAGRLSPAALNFERMFYHNEPRWELRQLAEWAAGGGLLEEQPRKPTRCRR